MNQQIIPRSLLQPTIELLKQSLDFAGPLDVGLGKAMREQRQLGARDRVIITDAVYAHIRWLRLINYWLARVQDVFAERNKQVNPAAISQLDYHRALLAFSLIGVTLTQWSKDTAWHVLQRAQQNHVHWQGDGVTHQWLLDCQENLENLPDYTRHNLPDWLAKQLQTEIGDDNFWRLMRNLRDSASVDLRVNIVKSKRALVQAQLAQEGLQAELTRLSPWGLRLQGKLNLKNSFSYKAGLFEVQDEGSQLLALLVNPKRNEVVIDFCAGAGGKTLALGAMMRNKGRLYAFDTVASRLAALQPRLERSGLSIVNTMVLQGENDSRLQRMAGKADRVLVDAPCSGLGTLRRNPDLAWRLSSKELPNLCNKQLSILKAAAALVRPGGQLIYATCSLLRAENQDLAQTFQTTMPEFKALDWKPLLQKQGLEQLCTADLNAAQIFPHISQTDGFFACVWQKKESL